MDVDTHRSASGAGTDTRPRAFYPDYVDNAPKAHTPGWDLNGPERRLDDGRTAARMLAWFSFGLGALEVLAPKKVTEFLGVDEDHASLVRMYGVREMASGAGILAQRTPAAGVWSRVAGDALDLATLAVALRPSRRRSSVLMAMGVVAGAMALDALVAKQLTSRRSGRIDRSSGDRSSGMDRSRSGRMERSAYTGDIGRSS